MFDAISFLMINEHDTSMGWERLALTLAARVCTGHYSAQANLSAAEICQNLIGAALTVDAIANQV